MSLLWLIPIIILWVLSCWWFYCLGGRDEARLMLKHRYGELKK